MHQVTRKPLYPLHASAVDYGLLAQNLEIGYLTGANSLATAGTVYVLKLRTEKTITVTNIHTFITIAGATLTSGQNFAALYSSGKALLAQSADQSTDWTNTGIRTAVLTSPQIVAPGNFYVVLWSNGTTRPTIRSTGVASASINGLLAAASSKFATADTGITTTAPPTLGTFTADTNARWVGVS